MDIYLTDLETDESFQFPMMPRDIKLSAGKIFQSYTIVALGEIKIPTGCGLLRFSWEGMLPGAARAREPYVREWQDPIEVQALWEYYRTESKKLRLLVTETPINYDVYLDQYSTKPTGGYGDYTYNISLLQAKDLIVRVSGAEG